MVLFEQAGHGLGDALSVRVRRGICAAGFQAVVLISSDNPTYRVEPIRAACAALDDHDLTSARPPTVAIT